MRAVTDNLESYELSLASQKIYDFVWSEFCDWYIELTKTRLYGEDAEEKKSALSVLLYVLDATLRLLHPFMPFVTEEIYSYLPHTSGTIMRAPWPKEVPAFNFPEVAQNMDGMMELVAVYPQCARRPFGAPSRRTHITIVTDEAHRAFYTGAGAYFNKLAGASGVTVQTDKAGIAPDAVPAGVRRCAGLHASGRARRSGEGARPAGEGKGRGRGRDRPRAGQAPKRGLCEEGAGKSGGGRARRPAENQELLQKINERLESLAK